MRKFAILVFAATLIGAPALAKDDKPKDPNKKVCRHDMETGSIIPTSICHTRAEWAAIDAQHARDAGSFSDLGRRANDPQ